MNSDKRGAQELIGCTKGVAWHNMLAYIKEFFPPGSLEKIRAQISREDDFILFGKPILPISWVDYNAYMRFFFALDRVMGKGDNQLVWDITIWATRYNLRGIYKMFFSMISHQTVIGHAGSIWRQYYNRGKIEVLYNRETGNALKVTEYPDIPPGHEWNHLPFIEEAMRMAGASNLKSSHPKCIARGDEYCLFETSCDPRKG